jgi:hypothetical protein
MRIVGIGQSLIAARAKGQKQRNEGAAQRHR